MEETQKAVSGGRWNRNRSWNWNRTAHPHPHPHTPHAYTRAPTRVLKEETPQSSAYAVHLRATPRPRPPTRYHARHARKDGAVPHGSSARTYTHAHTGGAVPRIHKTRTGAEQCPTGAVPRSDCLIIKSIKESRSRRTRTHTHATQAHTPGPHATPGGKADR